MWNKCNVVMLPTINENRSISQSEYQCQHLYITSDEEIREGDYCIGNGELFGPYEEVDILIRPSYKIIASTDSSLRLPLRLPLIPQRFKGTVIKEALVEYEEYEKDEKGSELRLKVNPDGTINIKFPKDNFSREEVIVILHKFVDKYTNHDWYDIYDKWIEENL